MLAEAAMFRRCYHTCGSPPCNGKAWQLASLLICISFNGGKSSPAPLLSLNTISYEKTCTQQTGREELNIHGTMEVHVCHRYANARTSSRHPRATPSVDFPDGAYLDY
jgi:hypothetical protein